MKLKKLMAVVLAGVMTVGILAGCAGGSSAGTSLNNSTLNGLLDGVGSEIQVQPSTELDDALKKVTDKTPVNGDIGTRIKINAEVGSEMTWSLLGKQGLTFVVSEEELSKGLIIEEITSILTKIGINNIGNAEQIKNLGTIDTPEKLSAALVLMAESLYGNIPLMNTEYTASACKAEAQDGTMYWVIAIQVETSLDL